MTNQQEIKRKEDKLTSGMSIYGDCRCLQMLRVTLTGRAPEARQACEFQLIVLNLRASSRISMSPTQFELPLFLPLSRLLDYFSNELRPCLRKCQRAMSLRPLTTNGSSSLPFKSPIRDKHEIGWTLPPSSQLRVLAIRVQHA